MQAIPSNRFGKVRLGQQLGAGFQGEVIEAVDDVGNPLALKLCYPPTEPAKQPIYEAQRQIAERHAAKPPLRKGRFLFPLEVIRWERGYGYLMQRIPDGYRSVGELLGGGGGGEHQPLRLIVDVALGYAVAFAELHAVSYCYRDINHGGLYYHPKQRSVVIVDTDNVDAERQGLWVVSPAFAAPEALEGRSAGEIAGDAHSLAVLFYWLLTGQMPFLPDAKTGDPVFNDHWKGRDGWKRLPRFVQDVFVDAFGKGLRTPRRRPSALSWVGVLAALRDGLTFCAGGCHREFAALGDGRCGWCGCKAKAGPRVRFGGAEIVVGPCARVYQHHVHPAGSPLTPVAHFRRAADKTTVMVNESQKMWWRWRDRWWHRWQQVPPGGSVVMGDRRAVEFGGRAVGKMEVRSGCGAAGAKP